MNKLGQLSEIRHVATIFDRRYNSLPLSVPFARLAARLRRLSAIRRIHELMSHRKAHNFAVRSGYESFSDVPLSKLIQFLRRIEGVAVVELALVMPLFVLLFLGGVEISRGLMVQENLTNAAREGARYAAAQNNPTPAAVSAVVTNYLTLARLPAASVTFDTSKGDGVTVSMPYSTVTFVPVKFLSGVTLTATSVFPRLNTSVQ